MWDTNYDARNDASLEKMKIKVNQIDTELDDMQAKMNDSAIDLSGGIKFASQSKVRALFVTQVEKKHKEKHVGLVWPLWSFKYFEGWQSIN